MKITKIEIENFRSIQSITIHPQQILALVGRNNSGKSNIIKALDLFFGCSTRDVNKECFHNHDTKESIKIYVTFKELNNWEKQELKPWMDEEKLVVGREFICTDEESYDIKHLAIVKVPEPEWLQENKINGENITQWWTKKSELKINGLDFEEKLGTTKPGVAKWKEIASSFIEEYKDQITFIEDKIENPKGYPGVLKGTLPNFICIPAVRDISDEAKVAKTNPFGKLINTILEKISKEQKELISTRLNDIQMLLNREGGLKRFEEIKEMENRLNELIDELMECDIEIEIALPELKEVFGGAKIFANDGVRTAIETKGHGLQRTMILTILRAYSELPEIQKSVTNEGQTTIFAIEEPELYLHPQSQRTLMSVFSKIASKKEQIIYSTHSSLFVDICSFDQICILRREKTGDEYKSHSTQLTIEDMLNDLLARKGIKGTEYNIREQYSHVFNTIVNEGFFADKVIIVEGPSEYYSLPIYSDTLGYNLDKNNISVVHSGGKGQMDRLFRVFNGFFIPTYLLFDGDKNSTDSDTKAKSLELLKLLDVKINKAEEIKTTIEDNYAILDNNFDDILRKEILDYDDIIDEAGKTLGPTGKPLKNKFLATKIKKKVDSGCNVEDVMPESIVKIISKIIKLTYKRNILRKIDLNT
jgi:putative ATP-dependent endonuclease of the OLD family